MASKYSIGLDFGTNSVRALIVDLTNEREVASSVFDYKRGDKGVILSPADANLARQHPLDYIEGTETAVKNALAEAKAKDSSFDAAHVIGIGVDTTGSTPIPVDAQGKPLALDPAYADELAALAWLWKDHTGHAEAAEITAHAAKLRPQYLAKCGGTYSSEWFWSKILRCLRAAPKVFAAAASWVEHADWMPALLTGTEGLDVLKRGICSAGHKAMFNAQWGGYPDAEFLKGLDPGLVRVRESLPDKCYAVDTAAGGLTAEWAGKLGLTAGIPVAVGAFDAHLGAVGSGIKPGTLVKIIGTSTCDIGIAPLSRELPDVPGLCGIVPESVLPGMYGLEAGQSAVGDIFNWFVNQIQPLGAAGTHEALTASATKLAPGESGVLALDWHNGNRTILIDQRLTGTLVGLTLQTTPAEIYRALVEATAFGARTIIERFEEYGIKIERVVNCGGISLKNPMVMQIYADVIGRPLEISSSTQTCALGSAIAGAVVAGKAAGGFDDFATATGALAKMHPTRFEPNAAAVVTYDKLYKLYRKLHDGLGTREGSGSLFDVMKELMDIRDGVKGAAHA